MENFTNPIKLHVSHSKLSGNRKRVFYVFKCMCGTHFVARQDCKRISCGCKSPVRKAHTKETRNKISISQKLLGDNHWTKRPEVRRKMKLSKKGFVPWNKGLVLSPKSYLNQIIRSSKRYKEWRTSVFSRDGYRCIMCGDNKGGNLQVDHLKPLSYLIRTFGIDSIRDAELCDKLWNTQNGRTLCKNCHMKTDTFGGRSLKYII